MTKPFHYRDITSFFSKNPSPTPTMKKCYITKTGRLRKINPKYDPKIIKRKNADSNDVFYFYEGTGRPSKVKIVCNELGCHAESYKNDQGKSIRCGEAVINESGWLMQIDVESSFKRLGVATAMIKVLVKTVPHFKVPYHGNAIDNDDLHLTADGRRLVKSCIDKGVLKESHWDAPVPFAVMPQFG